MTVTTTAVRESKSGDGVTVSWSFSTFVALDPSHVKVKLRDEVTGVITALVYGTDYSVALTGTARPAAGAITLLGSYASSPPDTDTEIEIYRETPRTQDTPLDPRSGFTSGNPEAIFDRYVLLAQEAFDRAARAMVLDAGDEPAALDALPNLIDRASKYLGFDADGQPVALDAPAGTTSVSVYMAALLTSASEAALKAAMNAEAGTDFAGIATANTFTATPQIVAVNAAEVELYLDRTDTHGDGVNVGSFVLRGRDSGGATQVYARIRGECVLDNAGAETGGLIVATGNAGLTTPRLQVRTGIFTPNATGGDQGADTINVSNYYRNGTQLMRAGTVLEKNPTTADSVTTGAHGLGAAPNMIVGYLECLSTDNGYAAGDRIFFASGRTAASTDTGIEFAADATNCIVVISAAIHTVDKGTLNVEALDLTKWKAVIRPYLLG